MLADRRVAGQVALGLPVQLQRLPVGREGRGLAGGGQGVPVGRLGQPGQVELGRDEGVAVAAPGERVADEGVAEVEAGLVRARLDQVPLLEAAQAVVDGVRGQPADGDQQVELEGPADHRARPGHRQRGLVQPPGPASTASARVSGTGTAATPPGSGPVAASGRAASSSSTCRGMPSLRSWTAAATPAGGGWPSRAPARAAVWAGSSRGRRISSASRWGSSRAGQVPDHLEAELVGPVEVLEHDQQRPGPAQVTERVGEVLDEHPPLAVAVAADPAGLAQPGRHGPAERRRPLVGGLAQVAGQVEQQPARGFAVAGKGGHPDQPERPRAGGFGHGGEQPGLADPGLAGDQQQVASAAGG